MLYKLPVARAGQRIGILGGSFDPPHLGHLHISRAALRRFGLDQVWWLVTPGNPLKTRGPAPMGQRMEAARALVKHPRIHVTDFEAHVGTRYTAETIDALHDRYHGVDFTWLMGADNLAQFHKWENWQGIMMSVRVGVVARPGDRISARLSPAARRFEQSRLRGRKAHLLAGAKAPAWSFINVPMNDMSSTDIRARGEWVTPDK